jgi:hypothetical protein
MRELVGEELRFSHALHEAGHTVGLLWLLGRVPDVVSIRAGASYHGTMIEADWPPLDLGGYNRGNPVCRADVALRNRVEAEMLVFLLGPAAEGLQFTPLVGGFPPPPPDIDRQRADVLALSLARLSPRESELLEAREAILPDPEPRDDTDNAMSLSEELVKGEAGWHVLWLAASAQRAAERFGRFIVAIAEALNERTVIPGKDALAIFDRVLEEGEADRPSAA